MRVKKFMAILLSALLFVNMFNTSLTAHAAEYTVTSRSTLSAINPETGGLLAFGEYFINGVRSYCIEYNKTSPAETQSISSVSESSNQLLRKALYYGYGGPGSVISSFSSDITIQKALTAIACSDAYIGESATGVASYWDRFYNALSGYASPPSGFKVYIAVTPSTGMQDLAFYTYDTNYTLTFDTDGGNISASSDWIGSGETATKNVSFGSEYGALPMGYMNNGWYSNIIESVSFDSGYEITTAGALSSNSQYAVTPDLIPVRGGITLKSNMEVCGIYTYDSNGTFIERVSTYATTHPISMGASYIRIELKISETSLDDYMSNLEVINEISTPTVEKSGYIFDGWHADLMEHVSFNRGYEITTAGALSSNGQYAATPDLIPIQGGTTLKSNMEVCGVYAYDANGAFIGRASTYTTTHNVPAGASYIRIELKISETSLDTYLSELEMLYEVSSFSINKIQSDHTLYAQWKEADIFNITYELDEGENHPDNPSEYTSGVGVEELFDPTKDGHEFKGWYEDAEFTIPITSIVPERTGDITLYAKWSQLIQVVYDGNEADGGSEQADVVSETECEGVYEIRKNDGYTDFTKSRAAFRGWDGDKRALASDASYKKEDLPATILFEDLLLLANGGASTYSLRGRSVSAMTTETVNGVEEVPTITLYAVWDNAPKLSAKDDSVLEFYEGQHVTKEMLLKNIVAYDTEDGYITDDIRITKIEYSKGKLVDGEKASSYTEEWDTDMPEDFSLDTWFLQMDKEDSPVTHKITYEVTDSYGNTTEFEWKIRVIYNEYPEIQGGNRYFTLGEAQAGKITLDVLLERARAWDEEDCSEHCPDGTHEGDNCLDDGEACKFTSERLTILGFDAERFKAFTKPGYEILSYHVIDQYGKETVKQFVVYILDEGNADSEGDIHSFQTVRFIDQDNYDKNAGYKTSDFTQDELKKRNLNGGLVVGSKWYTDTEYSSLLQKVLAENTGSEMQWTFTSKAVESVKAFVKEKGIGNSEIENGLTEFLSFITKNKK